MQHTEKNNQARRFVTCGQPAEAFQPGHAHEDEQALDGGYVMRIEVRIKIGAETKNTYCNERPNEAKFPERHKKTPEGQVERCDKEETIKACAECEPLEETLKGFRLFAMNGGGRGDI